MLEQCAFLPPLCAPSELSPLDGKFALGRLIEARSHARGEMALASIRDSNCVHAEGQERGREQSIDPVVRFPKAPGIVNGGGDAVRYLTRVQNRATASRAPHDVHPTLAHPLEIVASPRGL